MAGRKHNTMENNIRKLLILKKINKTADGKRTFVSYTTKMNIADKGEKELKTRWIEVRFTKDCIFAEGVDLDKVRGKFHLYTTAENLRAPYFYEVKEEDGKKKYPRVFIDAVDRIETINRVAPQSAFVTDEQDIEEDAD